ncbi:hypothetical protein PILCRDRAFT_8360 [Piloderma croceum F 1598]|uniref:Uncharacterized protein n=1 Tax=Piloderma croceum (strain F 1598) TaxID=765440 RepID=A0A0C3FTH2_PILCF|nr:hypothetical protein PILCRDRAFT_8360 [Piloderma croceum F 1598]
MSKLLLVIWGVAVLCFLTSSALPASVQTTTVVCVPTTWQDLIVFFGVNYIAHAGTVPAIPGGRPPKSFLLPTIYLFLPFAGLWRAFILITSHFLSEEGDISKAFAAGAAMIVVKPNKLKHGIPIWDDGGPAVFPITLDDRDIHGSGIPLPKNNDFTFAFAIPNAAMRYDILEDLKDPEKIKLAKSRSWVKVGVSIAQLIYSSITIYRTRGHQLDHYGYAAFGLSVFPYTLMSLANLICAGFVGEYPCVYVVRTRTMQEVTADNGVVFDGAIGILKKTAGEGEADTAGDNGATTAFKSGKPWRFSTLIICSILVLVLPHLLIFLLSGFKKQSSTVMERVWMLGWVCAGQVSFFFFSALVVFDLFTDLRNRPLRAAAIVILFLVLMAISVGGFVVVGKMIKEFDLCSLSPI